MLCRRPEAVKMCGEDPDFAKRDMWQHIEDGGAATWTWFVQVMTDEQAATYYVDPFDATKRWNDKDCPLLQLGKIVMNRNPENYHRGQHSVTRRARSLSTSGRQAQNVYSRSAVLVCCVFVSRC